MKTKFLLLSALVLGTVLSIAPARAAADKSAAPVVVKTVPENGATGLPPGITEIRITFNKKMQTDAFTFYPIDDTVPFDKSMIASKPRFDKEQKTFVLKLNLKPGTKYAFWINSPKFNNFRDTKGNRATPSQLAFETKAE